MLHFLTFADGSYDDRQAGKRLAREARSTRLFKSVTRYDLSLLRKEHPEFIEDHRSFISRNPRGLGYWLWKPFIIHQSLQKIPDNDTLIYLDAGCELNIDKYSPVILPETWSTDSDFACMVVEDHSIEAWTNDACLSALSCPVDWYDHPQFAAGFVAFRNNELMRCVAEKWYRIAIKDNYKYLIDLGDLDSKSNFVEHRHDQSIYTIILYDSIVNYGANACRLSYGESLYPGHRPVQYARNRTGMRRRADRRLPFFYRAKRKLNNRFWNPVHMWMALR